MQRTTVPFHRRSVMFREEKLFCVYLRSSWKPHHKFYASLTQPSPWQECNIQSYSKILFGKNTNNKVLDLPFASCYQDSASHHWHPQATTEVNNFFEVAILKHEYYFSLKIGLYIEAVIRRYSCLNFSLHRILFSHKNICADGADHMLGKSSLGLFII